MQADDVTIRGLAINRCTGQAIEAVTVSHQNLVVEGCFLGSSADGTQALTPYGGAISLGNHTNARIGGTTPAARNLIAGGGINNQITIGNFFAPNSGHVIQGNLIGTNAAGTAKISTTADSSVGIFAGTGITVGGTTAAARNVVVNRIILGPGGNGTQATGNFAIGNYVGTDVTGLVALGCNGYCISANHQNNTIGGSAAGAGNVIAGAAGAAGIEIKGDGTVVQGNFIGTDPTETAILPNAPNGIYAFATGVTIGGTGPGEGNVIAHNGPAPGVATQGSAVLVEGQQVSVRGNSIYDTNGQPSVAIDLHATGPYGITFNDAGDADSGPNGLQNFPIIASVVYGASTTTVAGVLNSTASTVFDLDFYATTCARWPQEIAEALAFIGSAQATTDGSGNATFNAVLPVAVPAGSIIAATATSPSGSTSELSPRFVLSMTPGSGPAAGGTAVQIKGLAFEAGATVTVGGAAATSVVVTDANTITANVPARPAGTINPVVVQNPSAGLSGTLANGWLADFNDVPAGAQFRTNIIQLVVDGITAGIGGGNYGPTQSTLRQQMAVFLLKAKYGICYVPPPCSGIFPDVPCPSGFAPWIEALAAEGITGGCGGGNYCPGNPVTAPADGRLPPQGRARLVLRAAALLRDVRGRSLHQSIRAVGRATRRRRHHRRLRRRQLLPALQRDARPDGGVPRQDVQASLGGIMKRILAVVFGALASAAALGNTYTVTSTADSGAGSLRQAILDANGEPRPGHDRLRRSSAPVRTRSLSPPRCPRSPAR